MVARGGAEQVSNAYPASQVADVLVGYNTVVAGSAAAVVLVEAVKAVASVIAATTRVRSVAAATGRQRFAVSLPRRGFVVSLPRRGPTMSQCSAWAAPNGAVAGRLTRSWYETQFLAGEKVRG
jgi:hypothetical protein